VKTIDFVPSITPGTIGNAVDFEALGTNGQIEEYIWNFGDNTPTSREFQTSHTYNKAGIYEVTLTIRYTDGTIQSKKKKYEVSD
jgi:PKD repeat protein